MRKEYVWMEARTEAICSQPDGDHSLFVGCEDVLRSRWKIAYGLVRQDLGCSIIYGQQLQSLSTSVCIVSDVKASQSEGKEKKYSAWVVNEAAHRK